jgi:hypothetical protein
MSPGRKRKDKIGTKVHCNERAALDKARDGASNRPLPH